jgi:single-strand DNA-binding protein
VPARAPVPSRETRGMTDTIALTGIIATDPRVVTTEAGLDIASFRLASTHRRFDRVKDEWVDGDTNWYTVTAFRALGANAGQSLHKGERVVVLGRLRVRAWEAGDKSGTTVEVDADAIGHDLRWGRSAFVRSTSAAAAATGASEATAGGAAGEAAALPSTSRPPRRPAPPRRPPAAGPRTPSTGWGCRPSDLPRASASGHGPRRRIVTALTGPVEEGPP